MGLPYSHSPKVAGQADLQALTVPARGLRTHRCASGKHCETIERSQDKFARQDAIVAINSRETLEEFCAIKGWKERLLGTLEVACCDPFWRVRNYASSTLRLMTDLELLEPARMLALIEAGTFFKTPRLTAFPDLDGDARFNAEEIPLNREWGARANLRAAGLWAWAESSAIFTAPSTGTHGFLKLYPPGSSRSFPYAEVGHRDPFGIAGTQQLPGLMRQFLSFSQNNPGTYTRNRQFVQTGIAMLVLGAPNSTRPLDAGQLDRLYSALAPKRAA